MTVTGTKTDRGLKSAVRGTLKTNPELLAFWRAKLATGSYADEQEKAHLEKMIAFAE
jgi:hypothetical protein